MNNENERAGGTLRRSAGPIFAALLVAVTLLGVLAPRDAAAPPPPPPPPPSSTDNLLMHNSDRFGTCSDSNYNGTSAATCTTNGLPAGSATWTPTAKWAGSWGVTNGKYGAISCATCHQPRATNIKGIKAKFIAPDLTSFPGSTVIFKEATNPTGSAYGFGNDADNHSTSTRVCEVCHSQTSHHRYNATGQTDNPIRGHNNNTDCTSCHPHKKGFYAACNTCHGNPPVDNSAGGPTGLANSPYTTNSVTAGAHNAHVNTFLFICDNCHKNYVMPKPSSIPTLSNRGDITISFSLSGATNGSYSGQTNVSYNNAAGNGTKTCYNVYCHGATLGSSGTDTTPVWDNVATAACGACHGYTKLNPPTTSSHQRHAGTSVFFQGSNKQGLGIACTECHGTFYSAPSGTHVDGTVEWYLNQSGTNSLFSLTPGAATYGTVSKGSSTGLAPSAVYQQCNNVYCHSNVQSLNGAATGTIFSTPTWSTPDLLCDSCHGQLSALTGGLTASTGAPATGSHALHVGSAGITCAYCHNAAGSETTFHGIGKIRMSFLTPTVGSSASYQKGALFNAGSAAYTYCNNTNCHGSTSSTGTWGQNTTNAECTKCHGTIGLGAATYATDSRIAAPGYIYVSGGTYTGVDTAGNTGAIISGVSNSASVGAHNVHLSTTMRYSNPIACNQCHTVPTAPFQAGHNDFPLPAKNTWGSLATGTVQNGILGAATYQTFTPTYAGNGGTCSIVYCHAPYLDGSPATMVTPSWSKPMLTGAGGADCGKCHGNPPGNAAHSSVTQGNVCSGCHSHVIDNATAPPFFNNLSLHVNGKLDGGGDCIQCHSLGGSGAAGSRVAVISDFSGSSHHVQGNTITTKQCYMCHWEADINGTPTNSHPGVAGYPVSLVVWTGTSRPTAPNASTLVSYYSLSGTRTEWTKLNNVCIGCHNNTNKTTQPFVNFGDPNTPVQYAWDGNSIDAKYSSTMTTTWGKYSSYATYSNWGVAPKNVQKAYSAHGNAANNAMGWDTTLNGTGEDGAITNFTGAVNVLCFDCHNSHGSSYTTLATSYTPTTAVALGGLLKNSIATKGGYTMSYQPTAGGSGATHNAYNAGAALCFDCHMTPNAGATPWGYLGTYQSSTRIIGYYSTPYFGNGVDGPQLRYAFKSTAAHNTNQGGHLGASSALSTTVTATIRGLCTPCHDPHGVSSSITYSNYAVPLLKGTWMTSPYKEDTAPSTTNIGVGAATSAGPGSAFKTPFTSYNPPGYHIDQNTFSTMGTSSTGKPIWNFNATQTNSVKENASQFAGLCLGCHARTVIASTTGNTAWKSVNRVHNSVQGWGSIGANNNNAVHGYTCSKCHSPHNSGLPRMLKSNCLDWKHRGRVASGGTVATVGHLATATQNGSGIGRFPAGGGGYAGGGPNPGPPYGSDFPSEFANVLYTGGVVGLGIPGTVWNAQPAIRTCHETGNTIDATWPSQEFWNTRTPW